MTILHHHECYTKLWMLISEAKVLIIACKSSDVVTMFKKELLTRFISTDEGEVTQYLGCELICDRKSKTVKLVQAGYAERVLKTFRMWDCNSVDTPLDPNNRISKHD